MQPALLAPLLSTSSPNRQPSSSLVEEDTMILMIVALLPGILNASKLMFYY